MTLPSAGLTGQDSSRRETELSDHLNSLSISSTKTPSTPSFLTATQSTSSASTVQAISTSQSPATFPTKLPTSSSPPRPFVLLQPACTLHRYIRNQHDLSEIVERPERIKAVKAGVAAVFSRIEEKKRRIEGNEEERWEPNDDDDDDDGKLQGRGGGEEDELGDLMGSLSIGGTTTTRKRKREIRNTKGLPFDILESNARMDVDDRALMMIHGVPNLPPDSQDVEAALQADVDLASTKTTPQTPSKVDQSDLKTTNRRSSPRKSITTPIVPSSPLDKPWPSQLSHLISQIPSTTTSTTSTLGGPKTSEIPAHLPQGDLYLCRESDEAIFGALGTVCEAVDRIVQGTKGRTDDSESGYKGSVLESGYKGSVLNGVKEAKEEGNRKVKDDEENERYDRGFVVIRPPGHHCGESSPQGFCFVNNVCVAAAHAHIKHGIHKVVILDIDLHHGNGTQEIVWRINSEANEILTKHRESIEQRRTTRSSSPRKSPKKIPSSSSNGGRDGTTKLEQEEEEEEPRPLQIMYGSLHDILSFPCESGDPTLVSAASLQISGGHSQYISNLHLEPYSTDEDFKERLWPEYWQHKNGLGGKAREFLLRTRAKPQETLIIVSSGFDASTFEYPSMSRHQRHVPTWFYQKFSKEIRKFADEFSEGRLLFVLEGGYSDRALMSGTAGIMEGLMDDKEEGRGSEEYVGLEWTESELAKVEKACGLGVPTKPRRGGNGSGVKGRGGTGEEGSEEWVKRTKTIFDWIEPPTQTQTPSSKSRTVPPPPPELASRGLRGARKARVDYAGLAEGSTTSQSTTPNVTPGRSSAIGKGTGSRIVGGPSIAPTTAIGVDSIPLLPGLPNLSTPSSSYPPTLPTSTSERDSSESTSVKPAVKFVWKQGGIGGSGFRGGGEPRM